MIPIFSVIYCFIFQSANDKRLKEAIEENKENERRCDPQGCDTAPQSPRAEPNRSSLVRANANILPGSELHKRLMMLRGKDFISTK